MQHTFDYNGISFEVEVIPYKDCFSYGIQGVSDESVEAEMLTVYPTINTMSATWITLDTDNFPGIENELIDAGVIEPEIITMINYNFDNYPVYELSDDAMKLRA